jgi:hypothetical protein
MWDVPFSTFNPRFMQVSTSHALTIPYPLEHNFTDTLKIGVVAGSTYGLSIMLTKLSILAFFRRFVVSRKLKVVVYVIMAIVVLYTLIGSFDWVYSCRPLKKHWDYTVKEGSCINWLKMAIFICVMNTATDTAILILPAFILRNLRLPWKQKLGVILVFMTGGLYVHTCGLYSQARADTLISVFVITIVKLKLTIDLASEKDISWEIVTSNIWW